MPIARMPRKAVSAGLAVFLCTGSLPVHADYGGTVSVQSDGRYRGISYSDRRPQAQVTLSYDGVGGWYGGALLAPVRFNAKRRSGFLQGYVGRVASLAVGLDAEAGISMHHFNAIARYDYAEAFAGLLGERWSTRLYYSNDYFGSRQRSVYGELDLNWPLSASTQAIAHIGVIQGSGGAYRNPQGRTRWDLRVGALWRQGIGELQLAWVAASRGGPYTWADDRHQQALVLGLTASF